MSIPINGRIAVLDDSLEQALPIIQELSKRQCPCTYYSGELKYLPEETEKTNDIRVLFLDIYLTKPEPRTTQDIKSNLVPRLSKIISEDNFPYVIVYWSRHKEEHEALIKEIFEEDLPKKKPIAYLGVEKTKFFSMTGEKTAEFDEELNNLWDMITDELNKSPVYSSLLQWENIIHSSADSTVEEVFSDLKGIDDWEALANRLFHSLGISFSGKHYFSMDELDKNKSSLFTLNKIFNDTLEYNIDESSFFDIKIEESEEDIERETIFKLNSKLLIQNHNSTKDYTGAVLETTDSDDDYNTNVFNNILNHSYLKHQVESENPKASGNQIKNECSNLRGEIRKNWKKVWVITTPLCDYIQKKAIYTKVVRGILIESKFAEYIDDKSESIFISPPFEYDGLNYILVLQFRNLLSLKDPTDLEELNVLFRLRQNLIFEILSKLSRHISRQGVLYLDPNFV
jgi:hypothetical protein